jgi:hypothetical protein
MVDRTSRDVGTRERIERKQEWRPGSALDAPPAPIGYQHRWIRESVMEFDDKTNVHKNGKKDGTSFAQRNTQITLAQ